MIPVFTGTRFAGVKGWVKPITLTLAPVSWYGAGSLPSRERGFSLGVVDVFRGVEAEATVFVEVESVAEELQVSHAAGSLDDLFFGSG